MQNNDKMTLEPGDHISYTLKIRTRSVNRKEGKLLLFKNLTVKELYASIPDTSVINSLFLEGLRENNDRLAISAMEELILRGDTDLITEGLDNAFKNKEIRINTTMSTLIARSLTESCRGVDPLLQRFGKSLFRAKTDDPFKELFEAPEKSYTLSELKDMDRATLEKLVIARNEAR